MALNRSALLVSGAALLVAGALIGGQVLGRGGAAAPQEALAAQTTPAATTGSQPVRSITVVGQGKTTVKPDLANINVGVEVRAATVASATQESKVKMDAIFKALTDAGVAEKDIQTSNYNIHQERDGSGPVKPLSPDASANAESNSGITYVVNNMVNVKVRNLDKVGSLIDQLVSAGANNVWGVNFTIEDTEKAQAEARAKAIENAKARAADLAKLNGVTLGSVISVSEVIGGGQVGGFGGVAMKEAAASAPGISPGELEYNVQVQVAYSIQ